MVGGVCVPPVVFWQRRQKSGASGSLCVGLDSVVFYLFDRQILLLLERVWLLRWIFKHILNLWWMSHSASPCKNYTHPQSNSIPENNRVTENRRIDLLSFFFFWCFCHQLKTKTTQQIPCHTPNLDGDQRQYNVNTFFFVRRGRSRSYII